MEPYYLILRLPGEPKEELVVLIPFNPGKKDNLSAWLATRSDPSHYRQRPFRLPVARDASSARRDPRSGGGRGSRGSFRDRY